ncbi:MAG: sigma factor G inhibitor Gin [Terrisporobacter sp.]|uniref:sigma factor G inhibitor Gin n=1 Tax=Clostridia TaxID=186801 RepID=UPI002FC941A7
MKIDIKGIKTVNEEKVCYICRKEKDNGIMIGKSLICRECEKKIVNINIESIEYDFYKNKIKGAFLNLDI